jgi:hypothetical protein
MDALKNSVRNKISASGFTPDYVISAEEVVAAVRKLNKNKNDGGEGLSTNHFMFAGC